MKKLLRLPLLLTILIPLAIFNIYIAIANEKWYPWLAKDKWTGIEAIVSFVLNISIIYITFYIHRKEREERIAELEKQQKQINEQRREADFDRQALMLQNRINLLAEREVEDFDLEKIMHSMLLHIVVHNDNQPDYLNIDHSICGNDNGLKLRNVSRLFKNTLDLLNDINSFHKESGRQHLDDFLKIHGKFEKFINNINTSGFFDRGNKTTWSTALVLNNYFTRAIKLSCDRIYTNKILIDLYSFFIENLVSRGPFDLKGNHNNGYSIEYNDYIDGKYIVKSVKLLYDLNEWTRKIDDQYSTTYYHNITDSRTNDKNLCTVKNITVDKDGRKIASGNINFFIAPSDAMDGQHYVDSYINRKVADAIQHQEMQNLLNLLEKTKDDFKNIRILYQEITESN